MFIIPLLLIPLIAHAFSPPPKKIKTPTILVPGLGGSNIRGIHDNVRIWPPTLKNIFLKNWVEDLRVSYDFTTENLVSHTTAYPEGFLPPYDALVQRFESITCLPYDFRLIGLPNHNEQTYQNFKNLVEELVHTHDQPVNIVSHSLGGLIAHDFLLNHCSDKWKRGYIRKSISLNTPYGGSVTSLQFLKTKTFTMPIVNIQTRIDFARYIGGLLWTLPNPYHLPHKIVYKHDNEALFQADAIQQVINHVDGSDEGFFLYQQYYASKHQQILDDTGVETHILYCQGVPTPTTVGIDHSFTEGDGTVEIDSLILPTFKNRSHIKSKRFHGDHQSILSNNQVFEYMHRIQ